ncbi:uncharacterized protein si:dkey-16j16.4 isoform X3 [Betta splendens]|uniref:Uncharacterized protein si:dkey-16j16.4 isoform X3 n=1 Tax=Betta splendens TaxID=158456 RepID=A0A6P7LJK9_BETSP|nr:uncharacterized protein si:dkey-16j16.4 isoform X3 [Betta splendens]
MLKTLTKKLRRHSLNEIHPFQVKISYHGSGEGGESDDSEGENQELAQIDRERRRNCALTPLATSQQHNQGPISPARLKRLRLLLDANLDRHSSEEELERISCSDSRKWMSRHGDHHSSASSDEEVRDLCGCGSLAASTRPLVEPGNCLAASPSPVHFSSSPPRNLKQPPMRFQLQVVQPVARPIILSHFDQSAPYRKYRHSYSGEPGRPSLDLEKMQQPDARWSSWSGMKEREARMADVCPRFVTKAENAAEEELWGKNADHKDSDSCCFVASVPGPRSD